MASGELHDEVVEHLSPSESTPLLADSSSRALVEPTKDDWWSELWLLLRYSLPLIATYLLQYSWCVIVTFICGHLSADALAAASVGMTTMNIVGFAVFEGMATALDTLCAQAYGSGSHTGVGLHVQRMLILMACAAVPIAAIWAASPWILSLFIKQQHLAVMAGTFLRVSIIGIPGYSSFEALKRFLQAQGNFKAASKSSPTLFLFSSRHCQQRKSLVELGLCVMGFGIFSPIDCRARSRRQSLTPNIAVCILVACAPVNALLSWLFAFKMGMGLPGAALGAALTNNLRPTLLLLYIVSPAGRWSHKCWGGFSHAALSISKWKPMIKLSLAGSAVNLAEWIAFEVVVLSTSYLSTQQYVTPRRRLLPGWRILALCAATCSPTPPTSPKMSRTVLLAVITNSCVLTVSRPRRC